jgi:hypothetical protein
VNGLRLTVQITRTSDGKQDYIQIMSQDMVSVNVVFVADQIKLRDDREPPRGRKVGRGE